MFAVALFTPPTPSTLLTTVAGWSTELFDALMPMALIALGLFVAGMFVRYLLSRAKGAVKIFAGSRGGRRRGR
jgi:hypothetical protein